MNNRIRLSLMLAPACLLTAWANSVIDVVTDNNYRLRGEIISYGKQGIVIKHQAMRQNAVILPSGTLREPPLRIFAPGTKFSWLRGTGTSSRAISFPSHRTKCSTGTYWAMNVPFPAARWPGSG